MKILIILLLSISMELSFAAQEIQVGTVYFEDTRELVEKYSFEAVTSEVNIDINLDGIIETALGITCGNAGCNYHIFRSTNKGGRKYLGNIFFHPKAITIEPKTKIIKTYIRSNAVEGCDTFYSHNHQGFKRLKSECK